MKLLWIYLSYSLLYFLLTAQIAAASHAHFFICDLPCTSNSVCLQSALQRECVDWRLFSDCSSDFEGVTLCTMKSDPRRTVSLYDTSVLLGCEINSDCRSGTQCQIFKTQKQGWCLPSLLRSLSSCQVGQYLSSEGCTCKLFIHSALACDSICLACRGPSNSDCTACPASSVLALRASTCLPSCAAYSYQIENLCDSCHSSCASCSGPGSNECITCVPFHYKSASGECVSTCPPSHYEDLETQTCKACHQSCDRCSGPSAQHCTKCADSTNFLIQGSCVNDCPPQYFTFGSDCKSCHPSCAKCSAPDTCEECKPSYLFDSVSQTCISSCPAGLYQSQSTCLTCNQACGTCASGSDQDCLTCPANSYFVPSLSKCTHTCPDSYYLNTSIRQCLECPQECLTCSNPSSCLTCSESTVLSQGACIQTCPAQQYPSNRVCSPCSTFCLQCNEQGCLRCSAVTLLQERDRICVDTCDPGFFRSESKCSQCDLRCATCDESASHCTTCISSLLLVPSSNECVSICPPGTFRSLDKCLPCPPNCLHCSSESNCVECKTPFRLQHTQCVEACSERFYLASSNFCLPCDSSCLTCTGPKQSECLTCPAPTLHISSTQGGQCISQCPVSFYPTSTTCLPCHSSCLTCSGPAANQCTDCHPSLFLLSSSGQCSHQCSPGFYSDQSHHCQACNSQCQQCTGPSSTDCTSCPQSYTYVKNENRCEPNKCPTNYFNHNNTGLCLPCHQTCKTCGGPESNNCLTCPYRVYYLSDTKECGTCPPYYQHNSWEWCRPCHFSCESCHGITSNNCYNCKPPYKRYADSYTCTVSCPDNYFPNSIYCSRCDRNCKTCVGGKENNCLSCYSPKLLLREETYCMDPPCPEGYFSDSTECHKCHSSCATCDGPDPNDCLSCNTTQLYSHSTHMCYQECPPTTFRFTSLCHDCHSSCSTCVGSARTNCLSCKEPLLFLAQTSECVEACPPRYFTFQSTCVACDESCASCSGPGTHSCLSCSPPLLFNPSHNTCTLQCSTGFYNTSLNTCEVCHSSCKTCSGSSAQQCLTCPSPSVINPDTHECSNSCGVAQYPEGDQCQPCHSSCASCDGPLDNNCLSCSPPLYFLERFSRCTQSCELGYYLDDAVCRMCPSGCLTCSSPSLCYNCKNDFLLTDQGACLSTCPPAHFPQDGRCYACNETCAECSGNTSNDCTSCASGYLRLQGSQRCVRECPPHTQQQSSICYACHQSCYSCSGPLRSQCTQCSDSFYPNQGLCTECPSSIVTFRGAELASILENCQGLLSTKSILTSIIDREVGVIYENHASETALLQTSGLLAIERNATNILARSSVSQLSYSSQNLHAFKAKLIIDQSQTFQIDTGIADGAQVQLKIPRASLTALNYTDQAELVAVVFRKGLYDKQRFQGFECPVVTLAFARSNSIDSQITSNFVEPLELEFRIKGPLPGVKISGAFWDGGKWIKRGITTHLSDTSAFLSTTHLTAFTLIIDANQGLSFGGDDNTLSHFYIVYWGLLIAILAPAFILDTLACRREVFPHHKYIEEFRSLIHQDCEGNLPHQEDEHSSPEEDRAMLSRQNKLFARLLKYSLLYSLPFLSPYSYRDRQIWASARALLLISEISLIYLFSLVIYAAKAYFFRSQALTYLVFCILLGLLLLPHSLLHYLLRRRMPSLRTNALPFRSSQAPFSPPEGLRSKLYVFLFFAAAGIVIILANVLSFVLQNVLKIYVLHIGLLTLISFIFGGFFGIVKIFFGTTLITNHHQRNTLHLGPPKNLGLTLFVDYMTLRVYQDFEGHTLKLNTVDFLKTTKPEQRDTERIAPLFKEMQLKTQRLTLECNHEQRVESSDKSDQSFFPASSKTSSAKIVVHSTFQRRSQRAKKN